MGLFNKRDDIPQIPQSPTLPELPRANIQSAPVNKMPSLPSMPTTSGNESMNREIVKSAVADSFEGNEPMYNAQANYGGASPAARAPQTNTQKEIIYVKIDKFQAAQAALNEIKNKVTEISKSISDLKTIKEKENAEVDAWDMEMKTINQRLSKIDSGIFGEV